MPDVSADSPSGPGEAIGNALANAPDAVSKGLERAQNMVQEMYRAMMQNTEQVVDAVGNFGQDMAGQATGAIVPDVIGHLPEVWL